MRRLIFVIVALGTLSAATEASANCRNNFLNRPEGPRQVVTLLTGSLTFQEAQALAEAIATKEKSPIQWVDENGKPLAQQFGEIKVVRPMPVHCGDKPSGVVMIVTFATVQKPSRTMVVKFDDRTTVQFDEQG
jgi:hypothetical protein